MALIKKQGQALWLLDTSKFLNEAELHRLTRIAGKEKDKALSTGRKTPVKDWFLVCVATETGLRVQEIADLCCGDFQMNNGHSAVLVRKGKGGKKRLVHIRAAFCATVQEFINWKRSQHESVEPDAPVFCVNGRRMSKRALQKSYKRILAKAGISQARGVGIHSLRHTYASFLLKASKFNLRLVQRQLGHESTKTTEAYTHVFDQDMEKALGRLFA
ncbi:MAG: site-specific integrase [Kiritimatiellae bacterium]|nr:site-specific integrase [Kiritimatiellia bacterium]